MTHGRRFWRDTVAEFKSHTDLRYRDTRRIRMIAATPRLISLDLEGRVPLADALGGSIPPNWPPELFSRPTMLMALEHMADAAGQGWSVWYLLLKAPELESVVGICGFKGPPDTQGSVEIYYSILEQFRRRGLASEAVQGLVSWAFTHVNVDEVCAETFPYLHQSIGVLNHCGFEFVGPGSEHGVVKYAIRRGERR